MEEQIVEQPVGERKIILVLDDTEDSQRILTDLTGADLTFTPEIIKVTEDEVANETYKNEKLPMTMLMIGESLACAVFGYIEPYRLQLLFNG